MRLFICHKCGNYPPFVFKEGLLNGNCFDCHMQIEEMKAIDMLREKYPLPFNEISKYSSFEQTLGKNNAEYTEEERKSRWNYQLSFLEYDMRDYWSNSQECIGCIHRDGSWCNNMSLPCTVNPVLAFRMGMIGMACMGAGYDDGKPKQLEIDFQETNDLPF